LDLRRFFFSERVVDRWNSLPQHVIGSASISVFKNGLNENEKRFDGLLYGLTGPSGPMASHVSEDSLEQVQPHLVNRCGRIW